MKQLAHKNIVHLIGVCTEDEPICAVMELMVYGDLKSYLLSHRVRLHTSKFVDFCCSILCYSSIVCTQKICMEWL